MGIRIRQVRLREIVLWLAILLAVLNFAPGLFTTEPPESGPVWRKGMKDIPVAALIVVWLLLALRERARDRSGPNPSANGPGRPWGLAGKSPFGRTFWAALALLAAYILLDGALRQPPLLEFFVSVRYYVVYPLVACAVWRFRLTRDELGRLVILLVALGSLQAFIALLEFTKVIPTTFYANYVALGGHSYSRAIGTLGNPNNLAIFLALPLLLLLGGAYRGGLRRYVPLGCVFVGTALTFSKAVGLALVVAVVVLERFRSRAGRGRAVRIAGVVAASVGLTVFSLSGRVGDMFSVVQRSAAAEDAWHRWTSDIPTFLIGDGFGSLVEAGENEVRSQVTDNMILALGLEGGLLLVVLFGIGVTAVFTSVVRTCSRNPAPLSVALYVYLIFFVIYSPFATNFRLFPGALFFWLAVGLALTAATHGSAGARGSASVAS